MTKIKRKKNQAPRLDRLLTHIKKKKTKYNYLVGGLVVRI
jgi:hypothetical protein